jgi:hypothetical protein
MQILPEPGIVLYNSTILVEYIFGVSEKQGRVNVEVMKGSLVEVFARGILHLSIGMDSKWDWFDVHNACIVEYG